jgi:hypothetical protein
VTEYTSHAPGTFCWAELSTTDQKAAVAFYRALFGWNANDQPMGPDEFYTMFLQRGLEVGAAYTMRKEEKQSGAPPHWNLYVAVASADETATRAQDLGATVLAPAFDVMDVGRMAILQDPTGAVFEIWEARKHIGAKLLGEPGALAWSELTTTDPGAASRFYTQLFGWTAKDSSSDAPTSYTEFFNNGVPGVGMMGMPPGMPPGMPSYWMPYFMVTDCDASTAKAKSLGANVMVGPQDIPGTGRFSVFSDPQGAVFAVYQPKR